MSHDPVGRAFDALADDTRRDIVVALSAGRTPTATELARDLPISRQAVTKHLRVLDEAGVVEVERVGREVRYRLRTDALDAASRWIAEVSAAWDRRLARLKAQVEADETQRRAER